MILSPASVALPSVPSRTNSVIALSSCKATLPIGLVDICVGAVYVGNTELSPKLLLGASPSLIPDSISIT